MQLLSFLIVLQLLSGALGEVCHGTKLSVPCGSPDITDQAVCEESYGTQGGVAYTCSWVAQGCLSTSF